ncbi:response regulator [Spirosoma gilvum]
MSNQTKRLPNRILAVDDNQDALTVLRMLLQLKGYQVQTCTSGQQALQMGEQNPPEVILLDISMPGMNGYETCRRIRQQAWGQPLLIFALTGYGQPEAIQEAYEAGFNGHLTKPVDLAALTSLLEMGQS